MAKDDPHFRLRIPKELKDAIEDQADANGRSINAEIVYRLQNTFDPDYIGSEAKKLQQNMSAATSGQDRAWEMLRQERVLYVLLDAQGYPISWSEAMTHLNAISSNLKEPIESIEAAVFTPNKVSSNEREQAWFDLMDYYRGKTGR